ncbi:MAG: SDR family oxidoreductase [Candidatus Thorarchaeota archaeon]
MNLRLENMTILVTGASRGLGFAVARALSSEGARVILCSRNETRLRKAVDQLGDSASYIVADVSRAADIQMMVRHVRDSIGVLDGLFVNTGGPPTGKFLGLSDDDWRSSFELTVMSAVRLTHECLPLLTKSRSSSILYNTSISIKEPIENLILSNSLRLSIIGLMKSLVNELGPDGPRVNAVCPGYFRTERIEEVLASSSEKDESLGRLERNIPLRRIGDPAEFGAFCAFIMSPVASYIHGAVLVIDGGLYRGMS